MQAIILKDNTANMATIKCCLPYCRKVAIKVSQDSSIEFAHMRKEVEMIVLVNEYLTAHEVQPIPTIVTRGMALLDGSIPTIFCPDCSNLIFCPDCRI